MLTAGPQALGRPVTHRDLLAVTRRATAAGDTHQRICLQARHYRREGPLWLCSLLLELGCSDAEWFKLQSPVDTFWTHGRDLRLCSPDGRCQCDDRTTTREPQQPRGLPHGFAVEPAGRPA